MAEKIEGGVLQFFADTACQQGVPNSIGERLSVLLENGKISRRQWDLMIMEDSRRTAYELKLVYRHLAENDMQPLTDEDFEAIQLKGSQYFFENYSPLAGLFQRAPC